MIRFALTPCIVILLLSVAGPARADSESLRKARVAFRALDYDAAKRHLHEAVREGGHSPEELVAIYLMSGQVAAAFGDRYVATEFFKRTLAIDPQARLRKGLAPKVTEPFAAARDFFELVESIRVEFRGADPDGGNVSMKVVSDPLGLVKGAVVVRATDAAIVVAAIDEHGNYLVERSLPPRAGSPIDLKPVEPRPAAASPAALAPGGPVDGGGRSRALYERWYVWGAAAVAAGGVAAYYGWQANRDWAQLDQVIQESPQHTFDEAMALETRGRRNQMISNTALGTSLVLAAVSATLKLTVEF